MNRKIYTSLLLIVLTISCNQEKIDEDFARQSTNNKIDLSLEEYISIAYDKQKEMDQNGIESIIKNFIDIQSPQKTKMGNSYSIETQEKYYINLERNTRSANVDNESFDPYQIPILKVKVSDNERNGLVFISSDERFPDVLAYIPSAPDLNTLSEDDEFGQNLLLKQAENALLHKVKIYGQIRDSLRIPTLEKIKNELGIELSEFNFDEIKDLFEIRDMNAGATRSSIIRDPANGQTLLAKIGPYIFTEWGQSAPYNNTMGGSCPDWFGDPTNYKVSAIIVATTQIFSFFEPRILANGITVNWPYLKENPEIVEPDYFNPGDPVAKRNMVAWLMKSCSDRCAVSYTCSGSTYYMSNIINFWKSYGVNADVSRNFDFSIIKTALDNVKLTLCHGKTSSNGGHSWLVDGYMVVSPTGSVSNSNSYVHANMGMGSYYNGYYLVNSNTGMTFDPGFAHFTKDIVMYTNISM